MNDYETRIIVLENLIQDLLTRIAQLEAAGRAIDMNMQLIPQAGYKA